VPTADVMHRKTDRMSKLLDTTVLVDVIRKKEAALDYIDSARKAEGLLHLSIVTKMELIIGCRDKIEVQKTEKLLADYDILDITPLISRKAYELIVRFSKSHGMAIPDAIIAATTMVKNAVLVTSNIRHFSMIEGLQLEKPY
jgi:predicted nucleic acid-binding protein